MIICPEYNYIYIPSISKPSLLKMCVYINICILTTNNREYIYIHTCITSSQYDNILSVYIYILISKPSLLNKYIYIYLYCIHMPHIYIHI